MVHINQKRKSKKFHEKYMILTLALSGTLAQLLQLHSQHQRPWLSQPVPSAGHNFTNFVAAYISAYSQSNNQTKM